MNEQNNDNLEILFREYEICTREASRLEHNVWQTAILFSIGSGAGLVYFLKESIIFKGDYIKLGLFVSLFAFFSIIVSLAWWRMARRWLSIQQLKYERMREIERILGLGQCSIVYERDNEKMQHIKSYHFIYWFRYQIPKKIVSKRCDDIAKIEDYEHRGIRPAIKLLLWSNAFLWIFLILLLSTNSITSILSHPSDLIFFIIDISFILIMLFLYFWRQR